MMMTRLFAIAFLFAAWPLLAAPEPARAALAVTASAPPFEVLPTFGRQGTEVFLRGVPGCPGAPCGSKGVRFNGVEASMVRAIADGLFATVPSLPEGPVDVSVVSPDGSLLTRDDVFRYRTTFDANDYARVLFPITYADDCRARPDRGRGHGSGGEAPVGLRVADQQRDPAGDDVLAVTKCGAHAR